MLPFFHAFILPTKLETVLSFFMTIDALCLKPLNMSNWKKKLPMQLTLSRAYVVPVILLLMAPKNLLFDIIAAAIFIAGSITDYYDGFLARKYNAVSNLGKFMDPVTDKILVTSVLIILVALNKVDPYLVTILLIRDTFIGGIRSAAAADQVVISAKASGKWKTGLQMGAIPALMIADFNLKISPLNFSLDPSQPASLVMLFYLGWLGYVVLWFSAVLSVISGVEYYQIFKKEAKSMQEES